MPLDVFSMFLYDLMHHLVLSMLICATRYAYYLSPSVTANHTYLFATAVSPKKSCPKEYKEFTPKSEIYFFHSERTPTIPLLLIKATKLVE